MIVPALSAVCVFRIIGFLQLDQEEPNLPLKIYGNLTNLTPGKHGIHVHSLGNTLKNCTLAGGHFNPWHHSHGGPHDEIRHAGDLGNIQADKSGLAVMDESFFITSLYNPTIIGRTIVVHENEDDLGRTNSTASRNSGNSGPRYDCCVVALASNLK